MQKPKFVRSAMRFMFTALTLGTVMLALQTASVRADTISGATAGIQVQNLGASDATVSLQAIDKAGTVVKNFTDSKPIPVNGSVTYVSLDKIGINGPFDGSLIISSNQALAAIANIVAVSGVNMPVAASYGGISGGAPSLTLPLIVKNNGVKKFDTQFGVQNAGATDTTVTVKYIPATSGNAGCQQTAIVKPGASATFNQNSDANSTYTGCAGLAGADGKFVGSATVESTGSINLAAAVLQASQINLLAYTGFTAGQASTNPIFPLINSNNNGNQTGIQIANLGTQNTDVTISYKASLAGTDCTEKQTVTAGASTTFALNAFVDSKGANENCADGVRFIGAGTVTINSTNQPLVAVVNQTNNSKGTGSAYNSFNATTATSKVSMPLIVAFNGKFKLFTGISVVNVGNAAVNINCVYSTQGGVTPTPDSGTNVAPGGSVTFNHNNDLLPAGTTTAYIGSADCTATGSGETKIVGVVNQSPAQFVADGAIAGDRLLTYEGFSH